MITLVITLVINACDNTCDNTYDNTNDNTYDNTYENTYDITYHPWHPMAPKNLLITREGRIKVTDFGFAKVVEDR